MSNILQAIKISGGILPSGSLRNVKIIRGEKEFNVDLYSFLFGIDAKNKMKTLLRNGDIFCSKIKKTIAIRSSTGASSIFEIISNAETVEEFLELSGAESNFEKNEYFLSRIDNNGKETFTEILKETNLLKMEILFL